ncbi:substrate-binding domain-containing protein [Flavimobilis sp. GY10621]|uniref:Substrate-binding domain-containing protein n=1 Tax=Flavimobilis rhizosphaerae TaxID=2775421 RepID=A0ABR9DMK5_9MICO|nr:substrate-binding domain-containing protein [Flavimobilis rhizosphaerae]MBD9698359.1 substrate-binding domain-containing protein [Flavimobilis rhizosphaerae]
MAHTLKSVAEAAGVSAAAVSYAFNRPDRISAHARAHILDVAQRLGYAGPDPAARSLKTRRAGSIGVVVPVGMSYVFRDHYFAELLTGVAEIAERRGAGMTLVPFDLDAAERARTHDEDGLRDTLDAIRHALVDGVIVDGLAGDHPAVRVLIDRGLPVVGSTADPAFSSSVAIDDVAGARAIGAHLAALGHRDVVVVLATPGPSGVARDVTDEDALLPYSSHRLAGFREGLGPGARVRVVTGGFNDTGSGRAAAALALSDDPSFADPTALLADSDALAGGIVDELRTRGIVPGRDLSVTGFDDGALATDLDLTTVRQPVRDRGRLMARMLLEPDVDERHVLLPTELVVRGSTGHARATGGR